MSSEVRRLMDMEVIGGRGLGNVAIAGLRCDEEVGREEFAVLWSFSLTKGCTLGATLNTATSCSKRICSHVYSFSWNAITARRLSEKLQGFEKAEQVCCNMYAPIYKH